MRLLTRPQLWLLILCLAACRTESAPTPAPVVNDSPQAGLVQWSRDPDFIVFRAEIRGGEDPFLGRGTVPDCTIYGDNRVVWKNDLDSSRLEVLEDRLTDDTISAFAQHISVYERIYTYTEVWEEMRATGNVVPVVEHVTIAVNGITHSADALSGWDPLWYDRVMRRCKSLSSAPVLFVPSAAWLTTEEVPFSMGPPQANWPSETSGLVASNALNNPTWVTGAGVAELWTTLYSLPNNTIYRDGERYFRAVLQVPRVTRDSPPTP